MALGGSLCTLRFLLHDRDPVFTAAFGEVFKAEGLRIITTLSTPRMNAICERIIGTRRRELLDRTLILNERHLALGVRGPLQRPQAAPVPAAAAPDIATQPVQHVADLRSVHRKPVVTGLINEYRQAA